MQDVAADAALDYVLGYTALPLKFIIIINLLIINL